MRLSDLKALQAAKTWRYFIYLSENQPSYDYHEPLKASLTFTSMNIFAVPPSSTICFMRKGDYLSLNFVTAVDCEPHILGDLLKISCKGGERYIVIAR